MAQTTNPPSDGHTEHTGHGAHHVFSGRMLKVTFAILCSLTVLTVALALIERGYGDFFGTRFEVPHVGFGWLSIPLALGIAALKSYFVAANFMGLKHDSPTYRLVFVGTLVFLGIFFAFTFLDFAFRDTFDELALIPVDIAEEEVLEAQQAQEAFQSQFDAVPLVESPDSLLFGETDNAATPLAAPAPAVGASSADATDALGGGPAAPPADN